MWDINDGRCFNISSHNIFNCDVKITQIEMKRHVNNEESTRLLFCLGK